MKYQKVKMIKTFLCIKNLQRNSYKTSYRLELIFIQTNSYAAFMEPTLPVLAYTPAGNNCLCCNFFV